MLNNSFKYKKIENKYILSTTKNFEEYYIDKLLKIKCLLHRFFIQGIILSKKGFSYKQLKSYQEKFHEILLKYNQIIYIENFTFKHLEFANCEDEIDKISWFHLLKCEFKDRKIKILIDENKYLMKKLFSLSSSMRPTIA